MNDAASDLSFTSLSLPAALLPGVDALGYTRMTPVQAQALPPILQGRDVIAQAPTGSGKTAAFGLGLLRDIDLGKVQTQALVLCPTRELADQVGRQIRKLALGLPNLKVSVLCGGMALGPQLASLEHDPHVVVGTPGRIQELLRKKALHLRGVRTLVLDEADRMLDMGFEEPIREIVGKTPKDRHQQLGLRGIKLGPNYQNFDPLGEDAFRNGEVAALCVAAMSGSWSAAHGQTAAAPAPAAQPPGVSLGRGGFSSEDQRVGRRLACHGTFGRRIACIWWVCGITSAFLLYSTRKCDTRAVPSAVRRTPGRIGRTDGAALFPA